MFQDFEAAQAFVRERRIEVVDLKFCDVWGRWHHVTIPSARFNPGTMEKGVGFDGSSVGFKTVSAGDMVMVPDLATGFVIRLEVPALSFICTTSRRTPASGSRTTPATSLANAEAQLQATGSPTGAGGDPSSSSTCSTGLVRERHERGLVPGRVLEAELGQRQARQRVQHRPPWRLPRDPTPGQPAQRPHADHPEPPSDGRRGQVPPPRGRGPGQCEIETRFMPALVAADTCAAREVRDQNDRGRDGK